MLSDFFDDNIESADAYPIFIKMVQNNINAYYLTMSSKIYKYFILDNSNYHKQLNIIYGIRKINGNFLEKYFELLLRLKVVVTAEQYESIDNIFYNIDYITYIFLGHGVTYIKSYLYNDYISHKRYDKILLPKSEKFINLALNAGWKLEDIIQMGYPRWDKYDNYNNNLSTNKNSTFKERSIFLMLTWRKLKKGRNISDLYYNNIFNLFNDSKINKLLLKKNIKIFFTFHHKIKFKKKFVINNNIKMIPQNDISSLLKNSSLIITDFSSILFDAI